MGFMLLSLRLLNPDFPTGSVDTMSISTLRKEVSGSAESDHYHRAGAGVGCSF